MTYEMNTTVTFDSSAWIEYFAGTEKGSTVKQILDNPTNIITPSICLMEIKNKYLQEKHPYQERIMYICSRSLIIDITKDLALFAADIKQKHGLYTVDALIYATAKQEHSQLLTGDHHFEKLPNVILLE